MLLSIFRPSIPKSKRSSPKSNPRARKVFLVRIRKLVWLVLFILIIVGLGYAVIRSVLHMKSSRNGNESLITEESIGDVVGVPGVPVFPGSTFMFHNHIDDELVQSFLQKGRSAYVLPTDAEWTDVVAFYEEKLPSLGWKYVFTIDLADEDRLDGEYWVFEVSTDDSFAVMNKGTDGGTFGETEVTAETSVDRSASYGLRMYRKVSSVWYERISYEDALTGLSSEVVQDQEIDLILTMGSTKALSDSFPWQLDYPEMWTVEIRASQLNEIQLADFFGGDLSGDIVLEPIAFETGKSLEDVGLGFLAEVNGRRTDDTQLSVSSSSDIQIAGLAAKQFDLDQARVDQKSVRGYMALVSHPENGIVYAITAFAGDQVYFQYVIEHLSIQ